MFNQEKKIFRRQSTDTAERVENSMSKEQDFSRMIQENRVKTKNSLEKEYDFLKAQSKQETLSRLEKNRNSQTAYEFLFKINNTLISAERYAPKPDKTTIENTKNMAKEILKAYPDIFHKFAQEETLSEIKLIVEEVREMQLSDQKQVLSQKSRADSLINLEQERHDERLSATLQQNIEMMQKQETFLTSQEIKDNFNKIAKETVLKFKKEISNYKEASYHPETKGFIKELNEELDKVSRFFSGKSVDISRAKDAMVTILSKIELKWDSTATYRCKRFYNGIREQVREQKDDQ